MPVVEGQISELCRDLAVEAKRVRHPQEQAGELRRIIREWAGHSEAQPLRRHQLVVEDDAEQ